MAAEVAGDFTEAVAAIAVGGTPTAAEDIADRKAAITVDAPTTEVVITVLRIPGIMAATVLMEIAPPMVIIHPAIPHTEGIAQAISVE
jgi:hypothetical protein